MPNLFGLKLIPVVLATVAFWLIGWLWYGVLFMDAWTKASGYSKADFDGANPSWMILGVLISFLSVVVIGKVLNWAKSVSLNSAIVHTLILWIGFGVTMALYGLAYSPAHSISLFLIDAGHLLVGWLVVAIILTVMDQKTS